MLKTFGFSSTTDEILAAADVAGKRVLITGISAGLGLETARAFAAHGAHITGAVRNAQLAQNATLTLQAATAKSGGSFKFIELDLASFASVRAAADRLLAAGQNFDIIIANAGIMACPKSLSVDGYETQFATNHLGHFLLINRLARLLVRGARVVVLSSSGHRFADVNLDDPNFERTDYSEFTAYGRSKTANILFAVEFDRRHRDRGVRAIAVHPGVILQTELTRHMEPSFLRQMMSQIEQANQANSSAAVTIKSVPQGAATSVWAASIAPLEYVGGRYCEDCAVAPPTEDPQARFGVRPYALNPQRAKALWVRSEHMVGEIF